jgi:hypothetical protein
MRIKQLRTFIKGCKPTDDFQIREPVDGSPSSWVIVRGDQVTGKVIKRKPVKETFECWDTL